MHGKDLDFSVLIFAEEVYLT